MHYEKARELSRKILHETIEQAKKNPVPVQTAGVKAGKVIPEKISDLIDASCHRPEVKDLFRQLFTELLGVEAPEVATATTPETTVRVDTGYKVGMVVVPLQNPNKHNYAIGYPVLVVSVDKDVDAKALRVDGSIGNYLPNDTKDPHAVRLATDEEIAEFYDALASSHKNPILLVA